MVTGSATNRGLDRPTIQTVAVPVPVLIRPGGEGGLRVLVSSTPATIPHMEAKLENRRLDGQLDHPALQLIAARRDIFWRQGHVAAAYRRRSGRTFGPYYSLRYRDSGRLCSIYLGSEGELVQRVRSALAAIQQPLVERRTLRQTERSIWAKLRIEKRRLRLMLWPFGLRMKGFEVRGWRLSPIRPFLPPRLPALPRFAMRPMLPRYPRSLTSVVRLCRSMEARGEYVRSG
jgi:hypothetical protein